MDFAEQDQLAPDQVLGHWYYQAKFELLRRSLAAFRLLSPGIRLADLGCGLGVFLTLLEKHHLLTAGQMVGIDPAAPAGQQSLGGTVPIAPEWTPEEFDLVLMMDVLEHIEDDRAALAQIWNKIKPGGHAFITVPAFAFLWSRHDEVLGHHRRYTRASLQKLLATIPDLQVKRLHYFYALILAPVIAVRLLRKKAQENTSDLKPAAPWLNSLLLRALSLEVFFAPLNHLAGLTVVALVQKMPERARIGR